MALLTLLPIGTMQLLAAIDNGYWYARSAEFMHQPIDRAARVAASAGRHDLQHRRRALHLVRDRPLGRTPA